MPTTLPGSMAAFLPIETQRPAIRMSLILGLASALLLPPIALLLVAAALVGHGQISFESISIVLQTAGTDDLCLAAGAC